MKYSTKITIVLFLVLCLAFSLLASAEEQEDKYRGSIGVGAIASTMYIYATAISQITNEIYPNISLSVQGSGGGLENLNMIALGDMDFGFIFALDGTQAIRGVGPFEGEKEFYSGIRVVFGYPMGGSHYVTLDKSGIKSIYDLKGKNVNLGAPGSTSSTFMFPKILEAHGITEENTNLLYLSTPAGADGLANGSLSAVPCLQKEPLTTYQTVGLTHKLRILVPEPDVLDKLIEETPGTYKQVITGKMYSDNVANPEEMETVGFPAYLATNIDVPEEVVYQMTKAIFENEKRIHAIHAQAKDITIKYAAKWDFIPLHPGAERYYREIGLIE